LIDGKTPFRF